MLDYEIKYDPETKAPFIRTTLNGKALLNVTQLNKGTAFTEEERHTFGLLGKLPERIETLEEQVARTYFQLRNQGSRLHQYIFLNNLMDNNQVLFYKLLEEHLVELLPIVYTPTVSTAVKVFSKKFRRPRGLYLSYPQREHMAEMLKNRSNPNIDIIVVTDGEGVLGIGDQGISAMDIPIAKLAVYTALGGINPLNTLPIMLDVGTNNETLLNDPMYLGWHSKRLSGKAYDDFIDDFISNIKTHFPNAFLHWEDLGRHNANSILKRYREKLCTFNDDIQGTGVVTAAAILAGLKANQAELSQQQFVIFGGGSAGLGIAESIIRLLISAGLSRSDAIKQLWIIDKSGLLLSNADDLCEAQTEYAHHPDTVKNWEDHDLLSVIEQVKPMVLIGCSGVHGAFNETVITELAKHHKHPIIMPLSNPTKLAEAHPQDLLNWTNGNAYIATGSPFAECEHQETKHVIAQCNNALIFPSIASGILAVKAKHLTENMLNAAVNALAETAPILTDPTGMLLPHITLAKSYAESLAVVIAQQAIKDGVADNIPLERIKENIASKYWEPKYLPLKK